MMDFLRRLAPARATDAARAVAVLPSRFSGSHPLAGTGDQAQTARVLERGEAPLQPSPGLSPAPSPAALQRHAAAPGAPAPAFPLPPAGPLRRGDNAQARSPAAAPATPTGALGTPPLHAAPARAGGQPGDAKPASPEAPRPAAGVAAALPALQEEGSAAPAQAQAQPGWPLSEASLAQRVPRPPGEDAVVHVTIGRIEVVAQGAAAPAPVRAPTPRQPSVTLADYLRGRPGSRP